ncbi:MAG: hypothetical protein ACOZIN_10520 [Myxococcota bacterium]
MVIEGADAHVAFYGDDLGWPNTGRISKVLIAADPTEQIIDLGFTNPDHVVVAGEWLYWGDRSGIYRTKLVRSRGD